MRVRRKVLADRRQRRNQPMPCWRSRVCPKIRENAAQPRRLGGAKECSHGRMPVDLNGKGLAGRRSAAPSGLIDSIACDLGLASGAAGLTSQILGQARNGREARRLCDPEWHLLQSDSAKHQKEQRLAESSADYSRRPGNGGAGRRQRPGCAFLSKLRVEACECAYRGPHHRHAS